MVVDEQDYVLLSGLQHFAFCRRQWALIHIEGLWAENLYTVEGNILHERAHDRDFSEKRGDLLTVRGLAVFSPTLGISGQCDVVEFHAGEGGVPLAGRQGLWQPTPVEYKRGKPKENDADRLQLCAQAMCLEEMLCCPEIQRGFLYYKEIGRREAVALDEGLRQTVRAMLAEMHALVKRQHTPSVKTGKMCSACSLKDLCLPKMLKKPSVAAYIAKRLGEEDP